jgi:hypothetical protein
MFALLAVILAAVGLFMTLASAAVPAWLMWAFFVCLAMHCLVGGWPFGTVIKVGRRNP